MILLCVDFIETCYRLYYHDLYRISNLFLKKCKPWAPDAVHCWAKKLIPPDPIQCYVSKWATFYRETNTEHPTLDAVRGCMAMNVNMIFMYVLTWKSTACLIWPFFLLFSKSSTKILHIWKNRADRRRSRRRSRDRDRAIAAAAR